MGSKSLHLVGGRPQYDLTIIDFDRWGMASATMSLRDTAHDGMNIMHKLHERPDWIAPFEGRAHHASWCQNVIHPDARLIAAAPELLAACQAMIEWGDREKDHAVDFYARIALCEEAFDLALAAIAKATGRDK